MSPIPPSSIDEPGLRDRIAGCGGPLLLDGATGTELERAGLATGLPLWSTHALLEAPECVARIHASYAAAGARIVTANTFRTQRRTLARSGLGESDAGLTRLAVALARDAVEAASARDGLRRWVAGSLPPLEDCYRPDLVPSDRELALEHGRQAELLGAAGVDLILIETINDAREAKAAVAAAARTGLPFVVGFVAWDGARLLGGEPLVRAAQDALDGGAAAVGVNCLPAANLAPCLAALAPLAASLLAKPNLGRPEPVRGFEREIGGDPDRIAIALEPWIARGRALVGGCCGTTPTEIAALATRLAAAGA